MKPLSEYLRMLGMEVPLCLYMLGSYLRYPVFQNLIYEKECLVKYSQDVLFCSNVSAYYDDKQIQEASNHFFFVSSLVLMIPSLVSTLFLGAATDYWSIKVPLLVPYVGCIIGTVNYIIQAHFLFANVNFLLISDAIFGICGGYISIISTTLTYGVKTSLIRHRSYRIAGVEGAIGLGGTVGYALSGTIREACGYTFTFVIILVLELIAFVYLVVLAKESHVEPENQSEQTLISATGRRLATAFAGFYEVLTKRRKFRLILALNLLAFGVELLIFAGLSDIQYSYLRFKLQWGDKKYGWYCGLSYGLSTIAVLFIYPLLRMRRVSDGALGCLGILSKMACLLMLAFVPNEAVAYSITVVAMLTRFVSTGFRAFISSLIEMQEQGKMFSVISLLEGATSLIATSIFNNVYPKTLSFFPGLLFLVSACLLVVPIIILGISDRKVCADRSPEYAEDVLTNNDPPEEAE